MLRHLNATKDLNKIITNKIEHLLKLYPNTEHANVKTERKLISKNIVLLGENTIQWITKRQSSLSAEAEYISAVKVAQENIFLIQLLEDLNVL